jgi:putative oxidoreductase
MRIPSHDAAGKLILRLTVAFVVLLHGVAKLIGGVDGIAGMLTGIGLPAFFAYAVFLGEVVGPTLMIAGFYARVGAILVALNMIVALALVHSHELFALTQQGGWAIELQALMLFGAIASMLLGPGRYAINDK